MQSELTCSFKDVPLLLCHVEVRMCTPGCCKKCSAQLSTDDRVANQQSFSAIFDGFACG